MLLFIIPGVFDYRAEPAIADHGDGQCSGMINPQDAPSVVFGVPEGIGAISERGHTVRTGSKETKVQIDPSLMLVVTIHGPNEPFVSLAPCQHDDFPGWASNTRVSSQVTGTEARKRIQSAS